MRTIAVVVGATVLAVTAVACEPNYKALNREQLDRSLVRGTQFIINNQKSTGNFNYEYNWRTQKLTPGDNQVRQAGAAWGLALIYNDSPSPEVATALEKALEFFGTNSRFGTDGSRYIAYPGDGRGQTGTVALVTLALIDYLRSNPAHLTPERRRELELQLDGYMAQLQRCRRPDGFWHDAYRLDTGEPLGNNNPYADGEALLAMIKAARYLGRTDLQEAIMDSAAAGWLHHVVLARLKNPDSNTTKGYYQWSSMAFFELVGTEWPGTEVYADRVVMLANWMIDVHKTLTRNRNTGYAYEGIIHAYELARRAGNDKLARKFGRVIETGLAKLTAWQVTESQTTDPLAIGGVQNHRSEAPLRIDVTQHQMHAVILARRYYFTK